MGCALVRNHQSHSPNASVLAPIAACAKTTSAPSDTLPSIASRPSDQKNDTLATATMSTA